jgi:chlorite dismutase
VSDGGGVRSRGNKSGNGPSKSRSTGLCSAVSRRHWRPSAQEEHEGRESERAIEEVNDAVKKGDTESKYSILSADVDVSSMSTRNNTADTTATTTTSTTTAKGQTNLADSFSAVLVRSPYLQGKQVNGQARRVSSALSCNKYVGGGGGR